MALTKDDFISNEIIESIQIGDTSIDIVGYVTKMNNNHHTSSKSKFQKFVVNNDQGSEVQVIAWNNKASILEPVTEIGKIVFVGSLKASAIKDKNFNSGNVNFELQVKENTTLEVYDNYDPHFNQNTVPEDVSIQEAYDKVGKTVKIEGIIKTELGFYEYKNYKCSVASLTDCYHQLEVKLNFDHSNMKLLKGSSVEATGYIEQFNPGPAVLRIDKADDLIIIDDRERVAFDLVIGGYRTK